jgi:hypothetical protein
MRLFRIASLVLAMTAVLLTGARAQDDPGFFITQSLEGLRAQTAAHASTWGLGREERWSVDMDAGTITFHFTDMRAVAPIQVVGTYDPSNGTFVWGWDHPSVPGSLREHARLVREFGERHGLANLTERMIYCSQEEAWEFTALAARLGGAHGAYRGDAGGPLVFMTFGELTMQRP